MKSRGGSIERKVLMTDLSKDLKPSEIESTTATAFKFEELTSECRKVWDRNESHDLEARYELGKLFIKYLNTSAKRQAYGTEAMKKVATALRMSRSELSRMRQFAEKFPSFAAFRESKFNCNTWTQVKQALVKTTAKKKTKRAIGAKASIRKLSSRIRELTKVLQREDVLRDGATDASFRKELQSLVEAAGRYLKLEPAT